MHKTNDMVLNQAKIWAILSENFLFVEVDIVNVDSSPTP